MQAPDHQPFTFNTYVAVTAWRGNCGYIKDSWVVPGRTGPRYMYTVLLDNHATVKIPEGLLYPIPER